MSSETTFSNLTLRNCAILGGKKLIRITLNASPSFPSRRRTQLAGVYPEPTATTWAARPIAVSGNLDISLSNAMIGEGHRGVTYSARINSGTDSSGQDILATWPPDAPHTLCVKVAKPQHCRALAREAWFYEQLQEVQGIATAICYGFYTVAVADIEQKMGSLVTIRPWEESNEYPHVIESEYEDWVPNGLPDDTKSSYYTDEHSFKEDSPWNKWRASQKAPVLGVLVLEKLGRHYYFPDEELEHNPEAQRNAMRIVAEDLSALGVVHNDLRAYNYLRGRNRHAKRCPRHDIVHPWRIVDFDAACMIDPLHCTEQDLMNINRQAMFVGKYAFWGRNE